MSARTGIGLHEVRRGDLLEVTQRGVAKRFYVGEINGVELYTPEDGMVVIDPNWDEIWRVTA
jgi:hypothetical protein